MLHIHLTASHLSPRCKSRWSIALLVTVGIVILIFVNQILTRSPIVAIHNLLLRGSVSHNRTSGQYNANVSSAMTAAVRLPALPSVEFYIQALNSATNRRMDSFDPQIGAAELEIMLNLLWAFLDLCDQHGIQAMLYGGTLLGSYRHHGFMPWDDDVDLLLKESDQDALETAIREKHPELELAKYGRWKVWNRTACLVRPREWCWPYLDLSFYRTGGAWIFDTVSAYGYNYTYPARYTFPTHKRPFMGRWVDAPRDALRFLGYDKNPTGKCVSLYYSHKFEGAPKAEVSTTDCSSLSVSYPFVIRVLNVAENVASVGGGGGGAILEALRFHGGRPVYTVPVDEPAESFNIDFTIVPFEKH